MRVDFYYEGNLITTKFKMCNLSEGNLIYLHNKYYMIMNVTHDLDKSITIVKISDPL